MTISQYEKRKEGSIYHYLSKYKHVPIWVLINYLNLGELRNLLKKTVKSLQNDISKDFCDFISQNIEGKIAVFPPETLNSFLVNINEIRNICAHNNRIIDYKCHQKVKYWEILHDKYQIIEDNRNSVYSVFVSLQCFISNTEYAVLHNSIRKRINILSNQLKSISVNKILSKLGFPEDWHIKEKKFKHKDNYN